MEYFVFNRKIYDVLNIMLEKKKLNLTRIITKLQVTYIELKDIKNSLV